MSRDPQLEPLLAQVEALAPLFGRAQVDLEAIVQRARSGDHRGVLQNTRLVVETLLRSIVAKKNQTPGKQTLEQLLTKLQNELPTPVQVHTRTIQAWGNVGAHDHADDLFDQAIAVGKEETLASLNALVVILCWYRDKHLEPSRSAAPATVATTTRKRLPILAGFGVLVLAGAGAALALDPPPPPAALDRQQLDALRKAAGDPVPPPACRATDAVELALLERAIDGLRGGKPGGARPRDQEVVTTLEAIPEAQRSAETWSALARALAFAGEPGPSAQAALDRAIRSCPDLAEAHNLQGSLHLLSGQLPEASASYQRALELEPGYLAARFNSGLVLLKAGKISEAIERFDRVLQEDPRHGAALQTRGAARLAAGELEGALADLRAAAAADAHNGNTWLLLGQALGKQGDAAAAAEMFCKAKKLGIERAPCPGE